MNEARRKQLYYAYLPVYSLLLFIALEIQNLSSGAQNAAVFLISCIVLFLMLMLLFAVTHNIFAAGVIISAVLLLFYTVSFYKRMMTGVVLIPADLNFLRHMGGLSAFINLTLHWQPVASILCAAALNIPLYFASKHIRLNLKGRATAYITSGLIIFALSFTRLSVDILMPMMDVQASADMSENDIYEQKGALLGFFTLGVGWDIDPPDGYSPLFMESLAAQITANITPRMDTTDIKPNVIIVMSESFWDPTKLPNIAFSEDPMPNLRRLQEAATAGSVVSPVFGGMTSNVEYEFLTGNAMRFVRFGDFPYYVSATYIDRDEGRALPNMFRANGYRTVAMHTYDGSFYDRDRHYPKLGFDIFIADEDMPDARFKGMFGGRNIISDEYFGDILIEVIEDADRPLFLFGITVQNHMPYAANRYEDEVTRGITADSGGILSEEDTLYLETFLEGTYDADLLLGRLYDYVMDSDEPTILVFFGDHLPVITRHTELLTELGFISGNELNNLPPDEVFKVLTPPYIAFSNYLELPPTWGDVSPYFLGALLAEAAGIELNYYYHFLLQTFDSFQALNNHIYISNGEMSLEPPDNDPAIEMFEALQFDKLFGNDYAHELLASFPFTER